MDEEINLDELELARARARARQLQRARVSGPPTFPGMFRDVPTYATPVTEPEPSLAQQVAGGMGTTLGPLFRTMVGGMAAAGSPGQRPDPRSTASRRAEQAEATVLAGERALGEQAPLVSAGLGLAGAIPRYGAASLVPGGVPALAAAEAAASRPEESLAGLVGTGARALGQEGIARRAESVARSPLGRVASDFMLGETIALPFRAARGMRARGELARGEAELGAMRDRGMTQYGEEAGPAGMVQGPMQGPAIPMGPATVSTRDVPDLTPSRALPERTGMMFGSAAPTRPAIPMGPATVGPFAMPSRPQYLPLFSEPRRLPAGTERVTPESDPMRLLAAVAQSLESRRTSPFAPGEAMGPGIPGGPPTVPGYYERAYQNPIGPMFEENPDLTSLRRRLMQVLASPPSETLFRNPETGRPVTMGGGTASRHGQEVPFIPASGGEGRRRLVPKENRPGEVVADVQSRYNRMLGDLLEGTYQRYDMSLAPWMRSPVFRANTPLQTIFDEAPAPLSPPPRQTPESYQGFVTDQRPAPQNLFPAPAPTPGVAGPRPTSTTTRLDPGSFPSLVGGRPGVPGAQWARRAWPTVRSGLPPVSVRRGEVDPTMGGQFVFDRPLLERIPVTGEAGEGTARRGGSSMVEAGELPTPAGVGGEDMMDAMSEAMDMLRSREGFITPQMLGALARTAGGGVAGATAGAAAGQTPEERRQLALLGLLLGAGVGGSSGFFARQSAQNRRINEALDEVGRVIRRRPEASPTAAPFSSTGAPPGVTRQSITGAPGVGAASPAPQPRTAGEPIVRPTIVKPKDEARLQRLNLTPEMQDIYAPRIRALSAEIAKTQKQTWQQLKDEAARLLNVNPNLLADVDPKRMTGAEGLAIASLIRENSENLARLAGEYDTAVTAGATADIDRIAGVMNDLEAQTNELLQTFMKGTSAQGRALQANRVLATLTTDPTYWIVKGQRIKGSELLTPDQRNRITTLANAGEAKRDELLKYLSSLRRTGWLGQVAQLRRAGLLTGLTGRIYDVVGTGINLGEAFTRPMAAGIDRIASALAAKKVGGTAAQQRSLLTLSPAEFGTTVRSLPEGMRRAAESLGVGTLRNPREWSKFIREAELDAGTLARYDIPQGINITMFGTSKAGEAANTIADTYQKFVMRLSGVTDKLYRTMVYNGSMEEQARLAAMREGLTGKRALVRRRQLLANPTDAMRANAMYQAELLTFTNEGALATAIGRGIEGAATGMEKAKIPGLGAKAGDLTRGLANILVPFRRTPANIMTRVAEYTPALGWGLTAKRVQNWWGDLALLSAAQKAGGDTSAEAAAAMASQRKMVESLTRNVSGVGIMALGAWMYDRGILTGDQPRDPTEAEQWRTEGRMPNAVMLPNGEWVSVSRLAPLGTLLAVAANYKQEQSGGSLNAPGFVGSAMRTVLDQPMLTGPKEAVEALTGRDEWKRESFLENMAGSFVPSALASAARASGEQRTPEGIGEAIKARIPGLEGQVSVRRNIFGEPLERARGGFMPTMRDQRLLNPIVAEMSRVGAQVPAMKRGKDEPVDIYDWRAQYAGQQVRQAMERTMASGRYRAAAPEDQKELLEDAATKARRAFARMANTQYGIETP